MFYSQFILAKKGPLGTIWIAAHLERKLRKNQVADTDIGVSVDSILFPDVPIALRLSSHLLLGVVRIYNRKVNYLFDDCSEALLKVKQAFRSSAVDLLPEESKAPYHSITLPETFDLDDFEMPDNEIFQGNYVDHHVSSKEQITLQDTMEGVSYSRSKFGLNERFGDGDASVLDLDEELFLDEIDNAKHPGERTDHQASGGSLSPLKQDEHPEEGVANSDTEANHVNEEDTELMDYAHAPSTPGLLEEPNLSNVKEALACDDHLESDYHMESPMKKNAKDISYEDKQEVLEIKEPEPKGEFHVEANVEYVMKESTNTASEMANNNIVDASDTSYQESFQNVSTNQNNIELISTNVTNNDHQGLDEIDSEKSREAVVAKSSNPDASKISSENQDEFFGENPEIQACIETTDSMALNDAHDKEVSDGVPFLRPCRSRMESQSDVTKSGCNISIDADIQSEIADVASPGREAAANLEENLEENLKENQVVSGEACHSTSIELDVQVNSKNSQDELVKNLSNNSLEVELPAPEKLLSVQEAHPDLQQDILVVDYNTGNLEGLDAGDTGSKTVAGNKRSFTESTLTEQSLNSAESSRLVRFKRTTESIPDDEDLLSSILAGRRSSLLKVKPIPRLSEATSTKRTRSAPRSVAPKRKVLMDDTMVLHGDTIRQQLTNTEDIRRVRKKAPCTRPEISLIQNQHSEDEIFRKSVFTGISVELASLHNKVFDLSRIVICANNVTGTNLKITADLSLPSQDDRNGALLETVSELNSVFHFDNAGFSIGSDMNHAIKTDEVPDKTDVMEQNGTEVLFARDEEIAEPREDPHKHEVDDCEGTEVISTEEQVKPTNEAKTSQLNLDAVNTVGDGNEIQSLGPTGLSTDDKGDASAAMVEIVELNETVAINSDVNMDVTTVSASPEELHSVDLNEIGRDEIQETNDVYGEGETEIGVGDAKYGESEYNVSNELYNATFEEQHEQVNVMEDGYMNNNGEIADHLEAYQPNLTDADFSGFDLHERDELDYSATGNDIEFLNVDDDDLTEMADDCEPDADEAQFTENTGWSSRTRAVSKYLQTAFIKETECGRKSALSLDNLLIGKSRKEASRMFFETLVLKTRDYIHVDQLIPFDTITIKPRVKLIKSDF